MGTSVASDRRWHFDVDAVELWSQLSDVRQYRRWWPWLRRFDAAGGFCTDACWSCVVAPPLPYVVRFTVRLDHVEPGRVDATVSGDVRGDASLSVGDGPHGGSDARLRSRLAPADPVLRHAARLAPPLVRWGHDWVLDQGLRQFVERALDDEPR